MRVIYCLTPCEVNPTPSDSAPEYVPLPMLLSERLVEEMLSAVQVENSRPFCPAYNARMQDTPHALLHFAAAHMLNSMLRLPQAVYVMRVKPRECGRLLKYCTDIVGGGASQRCITSIAITTSLRIMGCDPSAVTMSKCLHWNTPTKADHAFLADKECWS